MNVESALEQAAGAIRQGNKSQAQIILAEVIQREPRNEAAWLLLADVVDKKEHAIDCLERVLKFDPNNQIARERLASLTDVGYSPTPKQGPPREEATAKIPPPTLRNEAVYQAVDRLHSESRKKNLKLRIPQLVTLAILGVLVLGMFGVGGLIVLNNGLSPRAPLVESVSTPTEPFSSSISPIPFVIPTLPPEWTITPTPRPSDTPQATNTPPATSTRKPTATPLASYTPLPTYTPYPTYTQPPQATATLAPASSAWSHLFTLTGNGNGTTERMTFNPGFVSLSWNYAGSPTGGTLSPEEENYHQEVLAWWNDYYQRWLAYYEGLKRQALIDQDARRLFEIENKIAALTQEYNNAIAAENQRYENAKAAAASRDNTKFIFWLDRDSKNNPLYLDTGTGPSSGVAEFQALGGSDYYFIVEAAGPWTVTVYFKP